MSQVGSGALPIGMLPSAALAIEPTGPKKQASRALRQLAAAFRGLPTPVIGRIHDGLYLLDMRCLDDEDGFARDVATIDVKR